MFRIGLIAGASFLTAFSSAQYLRASAQAFASDPIANKFQTFTTDWTLSSAGDVMTHGASADTGVTHADSSFVSSFGLLRGSAATSTYVGTPGTYTAHGKGNFASFVDGVGASFNDKITLSGPGVVRLRVTYQLHSILAVSDADAYAESALDVFAYPATGPVITAGKIWNTTPGESRASRSFELVGFAGDSFNLSADLYAFAFLSSTATGAHSSSADASHTGSISIEAISGGYGSASGHVYAAPVPEPFTLATLSFGLLAFSRRRRSR